MTFRLFVRRRMQTSSLGQALVEMALLVPFLLMVVLNTLNFGYFFLVAVNLAASPRNGVEYSIQGFETPAAIALPCAVPSGTICPSTESVSYLSLGDITGALDKGANAGVNVCSESVGVAGSGTSLVSTCQQVNSSPTYSPSPDPEAPNFILNRVDVTYTFQPLIPGRIFNILLLASPICSSSGSCTFHKQASMREMN